MNKLLLTGLLLAGFTAKAEFKFESATFVIRSILNSCANCEIETLNNYQSDGSEKAEREIIARMSKTENGLFSDAANTTYDTGKLGFVKRQILIGTVFIREFDKHTYERHITSIPAYLNVVSTGIAARGKVEQNALRLVNLSGKKIADIFGIYKGIRAGINVALVGAGIRYALVNQAGAAILNFQSPVGVGIGFEAGYVEAKLVPGYFSRGSEILNGYAEVKDAKSIKADIDINELLKLEIGN